MQLFWQNYGKASSFSIFACLKTDSLLLPEQHGFISGRFTLCNLLSCDAVIADLVACGHCCDIISFDFLKAFDKAPHSHVIRELAALGIGGKTLGWFVSFLSNRTQQVKVANSLSIKCGVISGTIQGSVLGPILYTVLNNSLLRTIKKNPKIGFADDFLMIPDVTVNSKTEIQLEIDNIAKWAKDHDMPLSIEKSSVMHCGKKQPYHEYTLGQDVIKSVDSMMNLGIPRTADASYSNHCQAIAAKASRTAGAIRHAFRPRDRNLMWAAFQSYILSITIYCSPCGTLSSRKTSTLWRKYNGDSRNVSAACMSSHMQTA